MVANVASRRGWVSSTYRDGRELLSALEDTFGPSLLFLDILMPNLDGIETIAKLKRFAAFLQIRVRFVTGGEHTNATAARMIAVASQLDVGETIYKPVTVAELDTIFSDERSILDRRSTRFD